VVQSPGVWATSARSAAFAAPASVKFAVALNSGIDKTVYAFDRSRLHDRRSDGGQVGVGSYTDGGVRRLTRWSKAIPVRLVRATPWTCAILKDPLSFAWMDLDHGSLIVRYSRRLAALSARRSWASTTSAGSMPRAVR
jgi:hypothetical protein